MNYCTEEEAKTKWCPFARGAVRINGMAAVGNRFIEGAEGDIARAHSMCLGSACMAWTPYLETIYRMNTQDLEFKETGVGYCGLMVVGDRRS